ncbi:transcription intermediary factor 1-alpha-like [Saccostrea cucullata]|uniref:transcription intermediary factor 1-alpha-like n=1 Tax=Saccostrea cuccullata TaxID=36930 RepID=UPI002ED2CE17
MATSIDTATVFDCPICLEKLSTPKYLPCLHTFCKLCIQTFIEKFKNTSSFPCPVCRLEVSTPDANISSEEWANKLPLNHLLLSLQDVSERSNNSQDVLCEPCKRANETKNAKFYCRDCMDSLCENCFTYHHRRIRRYESHTVVDISKCSQEILSGQLLDIEEPCTIHKNKVLEVYCFDHEVLCCSVCFATLHRKCDEVKSLEEVAEGMGETIDSVNIISTLASIKAKTDIEISQTKNNFKQLEDKQAEIVELVVTHVEEAKTKLEMLKNKFIKDFQIVHDNEIGHLSNTKAYLEEFSKSLARSEKMLSVTASNGSKRPLFLALERIKSEVSNHLHQLHKQTENLSNINYYWEENSVINDILAEESVGNLQVQKSERSIIDNLKKEVDSFKIATSLRKNQGSRPKFTVNESSYDMPVSMPPQILKRKQKRTKKVEPTKVASKLCNEYQTTTLSVTGLIVSDKQNPSTPSREIISDYPKCSEESLDNNHLFSQTDYDKEIVEIPNNNATKAEINDNENKPRKLSAPTRCESLKTTRESRKAQCLSDDKPRGHSNSWSLADYESRRGTSRTVPVYYPRSRNFNQENADIYMPPESKEN